MLILKKCKYNIDNIHPKKDKCLCFCISAKAYSKEYLVDIYTHVCLHKLSNLLTELCICIYIICYQIKQHLGGIMIMNFGFTFSFKHIIQIHNKNNYTFSCVLLYFNLFFVSLHQTCTTCTDPNKQTND